MQDQGYTVEITKLPVYGRSYILRLLTMISDRIAGFASASCILLIITMMTWLDVWGAPTGDRLNAIIAIIGWVVTIGIGGFAFKLSNRQINLALNQLKLQQQQIEETRQELRRSNHLRLQKEFQAYADDVDRLKLVPGYLSAFTEQFPGGRSVDGQRTSTRFDKARATRSATPPQPRRLELESAL
jgi:hypothetical protein